jgi:hypothetical protein
MDSGALEFLEPDEYTVFLEAILCELKVSRLASEIEAYERGPDQ